MKKRITLLTAVALCVACVAVGAAATEVIREIKAELRPDFTVEIDGEVKEFKNAQGEVVYPVLYEGTTYLPIRAIGEIMGKTVYWYEDEKRIELKETTVTDADVIIAGSSEPQKSTPADNNETKANDKPGVTPDYNVHNKDNEKTVDSADYIGIDKAKEIALARAGLSAADVVFDRVEIDRDDGRVEYEVEFRYGRVEYDAEISAVDGTIYSWDVDDDD